MRPESLLQALSLKEIDETIEIELGLLQVEEATLLSVSIKVCLDLEFVRSDELFCCKLGFCDLDRLEGIVCAAVVSGTDWVDVREEVLFRRSHCNDRLAVSMPW